ncbi:hypothetical protein CALCODRAFT_496325 [Calocera cornea HHB12733]|uniref:SET domain-containing protein n=1 Tax=Calocera cornea HHB12733 TaxID=1353952 RepID=A0A165FU69_9BASI|nr:hypothetical protein CALCODRAFT_496325 [Calocera cornea HHB12733]
MLRKGLGLRARQTFHRGAILVRERPLLTVMDPLPLQVAADLPNILQAMDAERTLALGQLQNCKAQGDHATNFFGIAETNAFGIEWPFDKGEMHRAIFEVLSRVNHSCAPNAIVDWDQYVVLLV